MLLSLYLSFPKVSIEYYFILILSTAFLIGTFDFRISTSYNRSKEVVNMTRKKRRITLTDFEYRLLINMLVDYRNKLLEASKPTEDVNELLVKVIDSPKHR